MLAATVYFFDTHHKNAIIFTAWIIVGIFSRNIYPKGKKYDRKMVMTLNLAKNKQKNTRRAIDAVLVDVPQNGFTRWIYNGNRAILPVKINLPTDRKGSSRPKIPSKNYLLRRI